MKTVRFWWERVSSAGENPPQEPMPVRTQLLQHIDAMNDDELAVLALLAERMMEAGRPQYGPLCVRSDRRDFLQEALEEQVDKDMYLAAELVRLRRERQG